MSSGLLGSSPSSFTVSFVVNDESTHSLRAVGSIIASSANENAEGSSSAAAAATTAAMREGFTLGENGDPVMTAAKGDLPPKGESSRALALLPRAENESNVPLGEPGLREGEKAGVCRTSALPGEGSPPKSSSCDMSSSGSPTAPVAPSIFENVSGLTPAGLWHSQHLHFSVHLTPAWKHSQYRLRQPDFLQLHPEVCTFSFSPSMVPMREMKAFGFFFCISLRASSRFSFRSSVVSSFAQPLHLQSPAHMFPAAKHTQ
mmetsp:Transcript_22294/g.50322  ORF Transcript_22294/g.50322 Transcript_22294/m.50322 type:complete len:259 (-) Transcript_22294:1269-2045(-)